VDIRFGACDVAYIINMENPMCPQLKPFNEVPHPKAQTRWGFSFQQPEHWFAASDALPLLK